MPRRILQRLCLMTLFAQILHEDCDMMRLVRTGVYIVNIRQHEVRLNLTLTAGAASVGYSNGELKSRGPRDSPGIEKGLSLTGIR